MNNAINNFNYNLHGDPREHMFNNVRESEEDVEDTVLISSDEDEVRENDFHNEGNRLPIIPRTSTLASSLSSAGPREAHENENFNLDANFRRQQDMLNLNQNEQEPLDFYQLRDQLHHDELRREQDELRREQNELLRQRHILAQRQQQLDYIQQQRDALEREQHEEHLRQRQQQQQLEQLEQQRLNIIRQQEELDHQPVQRNQIMNHPVQRDEQQNRQQQNNQVQVTNRDVRPQPRTPRRHESAEMTNRQHRLLEDPNPNLRVQRWSTENNNGPDANLIRYNQFDFNSRTGVISTRMINNHLLIAVVFNAKTELVQHFVIITYKPKLLLKNTTGKRKN